MTTRFQTDYADRPGKIAAIRGVIFQSDGKSTIGRLLIRPLEALDRWIAGILPSPRGPTLAMHAGLHVVLDDGREFVAEQLVGSLYQNFRNGLNWTPLDKFRQRDRGGWDVTVPAAYFREVDDTLVDETIPRLNAIEGHPFVGEDCTAFIERAFGGKRRMFADSPLLRALGVGVRIGDPALPLLSPAAPLDPNAVGKLQFDVIKNLPDALADVDSPNARNWLLQRWLPALVLGGVVGLVVARVTRRLRAGRRPSRARRAGF